MKSFIYGQHNHYDYNNRHYYLNVNDDVVNMECKRLKIDCVTRVIDQKWEEMRGCECGVSCFYQDNPELTSISLK